MKNLNKKDKKYLLGKAKFIEDKSERKKIENAIRRIYRTELIKSWIKLSLINCFLSTIISFTILLIFKVNLTLLDIFIQIVFIVSISFSVHFFAIRKDFYD